MLKFEFIEKKEDVIVAQASFDRHGWPVISYAGINVFRVNPTTGKIFPIRLHMWEQDELRKHGITIVGRTIDVYLGANHGQDS